jgi:hypothetical protein
MTLNCRLEKQATSMGHAQEWSRSDAERRMGEVLEGARTGRTQYIKDSDGKYEVRFIKSEDKKVSAGDLLSRGGPLDD